MSQIYRIRLAKNSAHVHVLENVVPIYLEVKRWASLFPIIELRHIAAICCTIIRLIPYAQLSTIIETCKLSLILITETNIIYNVIDTTLGNEQIQALLTLLTKIAKSGGKLTYQDYPDITQVFTTIDDVQSWVQLANAFTKFCQDLHNFSSCIVYYNLFVKYIEQNLDAQRMELLWLRAFKKMGITPSYKQYVQNIKKSTITSIQISAMLVMLCESVDLDFICIPPHINIEILLDEVILISSCSIRLANDIRNFNFDCQKKKLNSILILMLTQNISETEAKTIVLQQVNAYLQKLEIMLCFLPPNFNFWTNMVKRLCWFESNTIL